MYCSAGKDGRFHLFSFLPPFLLFFLSFLSSFLPFFPPSFIPSFTSFPLSFISSHASWLFPSFFLTYSSVPYFLFFISYYLSYCSFSVFWQLIKITLLVASGMYVHLTAALGKRTKYQQTEHAQMYLLAKSSLLENEKKKLRYVWLADFFTYFLHTLLFIWNLINLTKCTLLALSCSYRETVSFTFHSNSLSLFCLSLYLFLFSLPLPHSFSFNVFVCVDLSLPFSLPLSFSFSPLFLNTHTQHK